MRRREFIAGRGGTIAWSVVANARQAASVGLIQFASVVLLGALCGSAAQAESQSYPTKPVRIISDSAAGSAIDTSLRIIAEGLRERWGQQVVIENRPGAGGAIAATVAAEAAPDGYTLYTPALSVFLTIPGKAPRACTHKRAGMSSDPSLPSVSVSCCSSEASVRYAALP